jgi:hypothetical protein
MVAAHERVIGQHRGNGHGQAKARHDERLAHRARNAIDGDAVRKADADQRMVDAPHRTEQADERRGGTDRCQNRQAVLQLGGFFVDDLADGTRDECAGGTFLLQLQRAVLCVVVAGMDGMAGHVRERLVGSVGGDLVLYLLQGACAPELVQEAVRAAVRDNVANALHDDEVPAGQRHQQQDDEQTLPYPVALLDEIEHAGIAGDFRQRRIRGSGQLRGGIRPRLQRRGPGIADSSGRAVQRIGCTGRGIGACAFNLTARNRTGCIGCLPAPAGCRIGGRLAHLRQNLHCITN